MILASRSPQRKAILQKLGVEFSVIPSDFDESSIAEKDPILRAKLLAEGKALTIAAEHPEEWVIGVDTLVVSGDGELLEKPVDEDDARRMLRAHSGKTSVVHSAICLVKGRPLPKTHTDISTAHVTFKPLSDETIEWWIATGLWEDRSGAFQIEGEDQKLVEKLEGEFETVVGFPIQCFRKMLDDIDE